MIEEPEETVEDLEHRSEELGKDIEETKGDWQRRQESAAVPGAVPDEADAPDDESDPPGDDESDPPGDG
ncbi:hypothetical protein BH20ACT19_BH20ACT19_14190 [soil metagenome]